MSVCAHLVPSWPVHLHTNPDVRFLTSWCLTKCRSLRTWHPVDLSVDGDRHIPRLCGRVELRPRDVLVLTVQHHPAVVHSDDLLAKQRQLHVPGRTPQRDAGGAGVGRGGRADAQVAALDQDVVGLRPERRRY